MKTSARVIHGVVASAGIAIGQAIRALDPLLISFNLRIDPADVAKEVARFRSSVEKSRRQLERIQKELRRASTESSFLVDAHMLILKDRLFVDRIIDKIEKDSINAEWAIQQVSQELYEAYDRLQDNYLRERRGDLEDIVGRLLHNLRSRRTPLLPKLPCDGVVVGKAIAPSTLFELRSRHIVALVTEMGSPLSHTAIMARSLEIPAVMGVQDLASIFSGELLVVDADQGMVICSPDEETLQEYRRKTALVQKPRRRAVSAPPAPCRTEDGVRIFLGANINFSDEVRAAVANGCESIGLYRTEFDFFRERGDPDEDTLTADYTLVLKNAKSAPVTFRTIDVGADRNGWNGANSNLGSRGLRFCLENQDLFKTQLKALFRASRQGPARILLPFVSTIDDLDAAQEIIADVRRDLARRKQPHDPNVPIGVMIETPAAAQTCDLMAARVDFFCLGTNDLIQFYLVIDRTDQSVVHLYNPFHPAILRCLDQVRRLLEPTGKPVTVCGEMAADPASVAVLLGLGFTSLSVSLAAYSRIRQTLESLRFGELKTLAAEILRIEKPREVEERVRAAIGMGTGRPL